MPAVPAKPSADPPRGQMVDIGGRRLRVVLAGERGRAPLVVCEAGAFGSSADYAAVQAAVTPRLRTLAYDRAGLGRSDPGPEPRDSRAITDDLKALLEALGEPPPYVLMGHSMAGVHVQMFALRWPDQVAGLVLLDALPPEAMERRMAASFVKGAQRLGAVARTGAVLRLAGLTAPLFGDAVGLRGDARKDKLEAFGSPAHNHWSAQEIDRWLADAEETRSLGELSRELPVAVVTAGRSPPPWKRMQAAPAHRSRSGYAENVAGAGHASLLGPKHCAAVVRALDFVVKAALATPRAPR